MDLLLGVEGGLGAFQGTEGDELDADATALPGVGELADGPFQPAFLLGAVGEIDLHGGGGGEDVAVGPGHGRVGARRGVAAGRGGGGRAPGGGTFPQEPAAPAEAGSDEQEDDDFPQAGDLRGVRGRGGGIGGHGEGG